MTAGPQDHDRGAAPPPGDYRDDHWSHGGEGPAALNQPADVPDHIPGRTPHRDSAAFACSRWPPAG